MNVGMEIEPDEIPAGHSKAETMVQKMSIGQTNLAYDTLEINFVSADLNEFKLAYLKPSSGEYWQSNVIIAGGDADQF